MLLVGGLVRKGQPSFPFPGVVRSSAEISRRRQVNAGEWNSAWFTGESPVMRGVTLERGDGLRLQVARPASDSIAEVLAPTGGR